ncbi:hypothetical protein VP01_724g8 [Puccinia sorghi]|uniref:Uncharacterized protein n=1 Tax=Puccinia sorghi TaxID=27349 RepID=A0A0L6UD20_9BASI|nr:hypothetical protein VP01_724g8 [Puccinia sorghi]
MPKSGTQVLATVMETGHTSRSKLISNSISQTYFEQVVKTALILLLFPIFLSNQTALKKRCVFVGEPGTILRHTNHTDDGFISKDCGSMFTEEEFAAFLAKQAADLAEFAITNREFYHHFREKVFAGGPKTDEATTSVPACGLLTCNKRFKRDVDFRYNTLPSAPN